MYMYNVTAIVGDRATLGNDPSASIVAYSIGRYRQWYGPLKSIYAVAENAINPSFSLLNPEINSKLINFLGVEPKNYFPQNCGSWASFLPNCGNFVLSTCLDKVCRKQEISIDKRRHKNSQDTLENAFLAQNKIAPRGFEPLLPG